MLVGGVPGSLVGIVAVVPYRRIIVAASPTRPRRAPGAATGREGPGR
jgi:hypothetical protein